MSSEDTPDLVALGQRVRIGDHYPLAVALDGEIFVEDPSFSEDHDPGSWSPWLRSSDPRVEVSLEDGKHCLRLRYLANGGNYYATDYYCLPKWATCSGCKGYDYHCGCYCPDCGEDHFECDCEPRWTVCHECGYHDHGGPCDCVSAEELREELADMQQDRARPREESRRLLNQIWERDHRIADLTSRLQAARLWLPSRLPVDPE